MTNANVSCFSYSWVQLTRSGLRGRSGRRVRVRVTVASPTNGEHVSARGDVLARESATSAAMPRYVSLIFNATQSNRFLS